MKHKLVQRLAACVLALLLFPVGTAAAAEFQGFSDVKSSDRCYDAVVWAVENDITSGTTKTTFSPNNTCTSAQILTFLWRAAGKPTVSIANPFSGVSSDSYYYQAALWAYENGMVDKDFQPSADCTRAMAVTYIWKAAGMPFSMAPASFTDVPIDNYELSIPVSWAVEKGITTGTTKTTFSPNNICTRAQIVMFLKRAYGGGQSGQPAQSQDAECGTLLTLINALRAEAGVPALKTADKLTQAAMLRADDISKGYFDNRPDGSDWSSVLEGIPATDVHESMLGGSAKAAEILSIALNTPEAKTVMLSAEPTHIGIGRVHNDNGYGGYKDFWSLLYIIDGSSSAAPAAETTPSGGSGSFTPVPMAELANLKSLQKKASDQELAQAYDAALKIVEPLAGLSREEQLQGVAAAIRKLFDSGMDYSMESPHYNDPYGYFILGAASCAGCTRATGLCLNILGIPYEHVNENQYSHQWCRVNVNGTYWICDAYGLYCGPEPSPYTHPYL